MMRDGLLFFTEPRGTLALPLDDSKPQTETGTKTGAEGPLHTIPSLTIPSVTQTGRQADRFVDWWKVYPKKVKKPEARKVWKAKGLDIKADELIEDVRARLKEDDRWRRGYIPDPTTYLRGERWSDEISAPQPGRAR
jgi:hypothetical protein